MSSLVVGLEDLKFRSFPMEQFKEVGSRMVAAVEGEMERTEDVLFDNEVLLRMDLFIGDP